MFVASDEEVGKTEMDEIKALSLDAIETATQDEDDEVGLPVLDPISGQVDACVLGKIRRFGRITTMHPGTDEEAKAIYCGLHGCRKLKGALFVPPERSLMVWYHKGCSLLAGSAAEKEASRKEHLKMFNTMFETPCPPAVPTVDAGPAPPAVPTAAAGLAPPAASTAAAGPAPSAVSAATAGPSKPEIRVS